MDTKQITIQDACGNILLSFDSEDLRIAKEIISERRSALKAEWTREQVLRREWYPVPLSGVRYWYVLPDGSIDEDQAYTFSESYFKDSITGGVSYAPTEALALELSQIVKGEWLPKKGDVHCRFDKHNRSSYNMKHTATADADKSHLECSIYAPTPEQLDPLVKRWQAEQKPEPKYHDMRVPERSVGEVQALGGFLSGGYVSEQKPEEAKTITLGPDTPLGLYNVVRTYDGRHFPLPRVTYRLELHEPNNGVSVLSSDSESLRLTFGATLLPVAPPVPEEPKWVESESSPRVFNPTHVAPPVPAPVAEESLQSQIDRLAKFIVGENLGYPNTNEGAIDTAIRIIGEHSRGDRYKAGYEVGFSEGRSDLQRVVTKAMEEHSDA